MSESSSSSSSGIGFTGLLTIVFIVLKLIGKINWSWWWVLSPLWIGAGIAIVFVIGMILVASISVFRNRNKPKKVDWVSRLTR